MSNQDASASGQGGAVKRGRGRPPKSSYSNNNNVSPEVSMPSSQQQQSMPATLGVDPRIAAAIMASTSGRGPPMTRMVTHPGQHQYHQMQGMYPIPPSMVQSMVTRGQRGGQQSVVAPIVATQETDSDAPRGRGRPRNSARKKQADAEDKKSKGSDDDDEYTPSFSSRPPRWTDTEVSEIPMYLCMT